MKFKIALGNLTLASAVVAGVVLCHSQSADAADNVLVSYEDECIETSCSNGEVENYHEGYDGESLVEWGPGNIEEDQEFGSNQSNARNRACSTATMLSDFMTRLNRRVDTDDWQYHQWLCLHL
jgi:hypothetical protein